MPTRNPNQPPDWWNLELYNFLEGMPLEGWAWEFMRRARLKELLQPASEAVDAMNPNPDETNIHPDYLGYYYHWNHRHWLNNEGKRVNNPIAFPPSVIRREHFSTDADGSLIDIQNKPFFIEDWGCSKFVHMVIDINRNIKTIKRDFSNVLSETINELEQKENYSKSKRVNPRIVDWHESHILQVWDLREFEVSWHDLTNLFEIETKKINNTRKAFDTAYDLIQKDKWRELARNV